MFLQTPTPELNILQQIDWRIATPIITFILGSIVTLIVTFVTFIFTFLKDYLDRRREIKNMKAILVQELCYNYGHAYMIKNKEASEQTTFFFRIIDSISTKVYEEYLGRLNSLNTIELRYVYKAYQKMQFLINQKEMTKELQAMDTSPFGFSPITLNKTMIICADPAVESIKSAIFKLDPEGGKDFLDGYHNIQKSKGTELN